MSQEQFLATVAASLVANVIFGVMAYAFFFMYWTEKKTGEKKWPFWMYWAVSLPLLFSGLVIWGLVTPSGH